MMVGLPTHICVTRPQLNATLLVTKCRTRADHNQYGSWKRCFCSQFHFTDSIRINRAELGFSNIVFTICLSALYNKMCIYIRRVETNEPIQVTYIYEIIISILSGNYNIMV